MGPAVDGQCPLPIDMISVRFTTVFSQSNCCFVVKLGSLLLLADLECLSPVEGIS